MSYATPDDLEDYTGATPPADAQTRLDRASDDVAAALITAVYEVDGGGMATDPAVIAAIVKAEAATAAHRINNGLNADGSQRQSSEVQIGSVRIKRGAQSGGGSGVLQAGELPHGAYSALRTAGLINHAPWRP